MSKDHTDFVPVVPADTLSEDGIHPCTAGSAALLLCRAAGHWYAVSPWCTHAGADLADGLIANGKIICPLHGAAFDLKSGAPGEPASRKLQTYPVRIVDGVIEVAIPRSTSRV